MHTINIQNRKLDRSLHQLRKDGLTPGALYGESINSTPVKVSTKELKKVIARPESVFKVPTENGPIFVRFEEIQKDPITGHLIHFSLAQMPQGIKNEVEIPVHLQGVPVGVKKGGTLVQIKDEVTVNGKPRAIPSKVVANISSLDIGDKLTVDDLHVSGKVDTVDENSEVIAICKPSLSMKTVTLEAEPIAMKNDFPEVESTLTSAI